MGRCAVSLEVTPPNEANILVLSPRNGEARPEVPEQLPHSPIFFNCDDIEQTHRELTKRGVVFPAPPAKMTDVTSRGSNDARA